MGKLRSLRASADTDLWVANLYDLTKRRLGARGELRCSREREHPAHYDVPILRGPEAVRDELARHRR